MLLATQEIPPYPPSPPPPKNPQNQPGFRLENQPENRLKTPKNGKMSLYKRLNMHFCTALSENLMDSYWKKTWVQTDCPLEMDHFVRENRVNVTPTFFDCYWPRGLSRLNPPFWDICPPLFSATKHVTDPLSQPGRKAKVPKS